MILLDDWLLLVVVFLRPSNGWRRCVAVVERKQRPDLTVEIEE